jgi:hypothetical protein
MGFIEAIFGGSRFGSFVIKGINNRYLFISNHPSITKYHVNKRRHRNRTMTDTYEKIYFIGELSS